MWSRRSVKTYLLSTLVVILVLASAPTARAQQDRPPRPTSPMEALQLDVWFEIPSRGQSLEDTLAALTRSATVNGDIEKGFLSSIPYDADQLTESAVNFGPGSTLKVWAELYCTERGDWEQPMKKMRGVLRYQVWVRDSSTGNLTRLTKLRGRARQGDALAQSGIKLPKLRKGDTLWFQILKDRISPLEDAYCYFGYGIYRDFTGE